MSDSDLGEGSGGAWRFVFSSEQMQMLRADPAFHRLLILGRILNSLRFAESAVFDRGSADTAAAARQRTAGFLYTCALLYEGLKFVADHMGRHHRHLPAFRSEVLPILRDPEVIALREGLLDRLRNQAVYHHDHDVMPAGLAMMDMPEYVVVTGDSPRMVDVFYNLSDYAALAFGIGTPPEGTTADKHFRQALATVGRLEKRFAPAAERLLSEAFEELGARAEYVGDGE
jgi:hypothetical protein